MLEFVVRMVLYLLCSPGSFVETWTLDPFLTVRPVRVTGNAIDFLTFGLVGQCTLCVWKWRRYAGVQCDIGILSCTVCGIFTRYVLC